MNKYMKMMIAMLANIESNAMKAYSNNDLDCFIGLSRSYSWFMSLRLHSECIGLPRRIR